MICRKVDRIIPMLSTEPVNAHLWIVDEQAVDAIDFLMDLIDWELNTNPSFARDHFMQPRPVAGAGQMEQEGCRALWVCYRSDSFSAQELTVLPGRTVTIRDAAAYGMIMMQGHGTMGVWNIETPALIRFGQFTHDEYFISESAAQKGVTITNLSQTDPLVMLKHFGPKNPDLVLP